MIELIICVCVIYFDLTIKQSIILLRAFNVRMFVLQWK